MIHFTDTEVYSDSGYVRRISSNTYFKRSFISKLDTQDMFEEVAEIPKYDEADYKAKVVERIRQRYTVDDELAIMRQRDTKASEYAAYYEYVERCKADVKAELSQPQTDESLSQEEQEL